MLGFVSVALPWPTRPLSPTWHRIKLNLTNVDLLSYQLNNCATYLALICNTIKNLFLRLIYWHLNKNNLKLNSFPLSLHSSSSCLLHSLPSLFVVAPVSGTNSFNLWLTLLSEPANIRFKTQTSYFKILLTSLSRY